MFFAKFLLLSGTTTLSTRPLKTGSSSLSKIGAWKQGVDVAKRFSSSLTLRRK